MKEIAQAKPDETKQPVKVVHADMSPLEQFTVHAERSYVKENSQTVPVGEIKKPQVDQMARVDLNVSSTKHQEQAQQETRSMNQTQSASPDRKKYFEARAMTPSHREKKDVFCPSTTTAEKKKKDEAEELDRKEREKHNYPHLMDSYPYRTALKRHSYQYRYNNKMQDRSQILPKNLVEITPTKEELLQKNKEEEQKATK